MFLFMVVLLSALLTGLVRRYALALNLFDIPNVRSSHQVATPRGGGVAIVLAFWAGLFWLLWQSEIALISWAEFFGLLGAGALVALIGIWDDYRHVPACWRLLVHFTGAAWLLLCFGEIVPVSIFELRFLVYPLWAVYLVWLLNLFNFMDGINGIAALEAITACLGGAVVFMIGVPGNFGWVIPGLLAAATAGFLYWNFPTARIFMGDAGSGFLGLMLGALSLLATKAAPELFCCWLILLGVFVVDATFTLLRRIFRREKFYQAHRSHAYQHAAICHASHVKVSLAVAGINLIWLLPIAIIVVLGWISGFIGVIFAYVPLFGLAWCYRAGAAKDRLI